MANSLRRFLSELVRDNSGQMSFAMVLTFLLVFAFAALGFDAGLWYFDHRRAQNEADAAVLAAAQHLPALDTSAATAAVDEWMARNGAEPSDRQCLEYSDWSGDSYYDTVRVCVLRDSPSFLAQLSGIPFMKVGAQATARVGPSQVANVLPWGIVPPDPTCDSPGELCENDLDGDGVSTPCGYYPPAPAGQPSCPWGLSEDRLYRFMLGTYQEPGNFGAITACGKGTADYRDCVSGEDVSGFYEEDGMVKIGPQPGNLGGNTKEALEDRYEDESSANGVYECDAQATPQIITGLDPDGRAIALNRWENTSGCEERYVVLPVIDHFPNGASEDVRVLGIVTFGIASWDRESPWSDGKGSDIAACGSAGGLGYDCGMVWGYLIGDVRPPHFLLEQIGSTNNPFAPMIIALIN